MTLNGVLNQDLERHGSYSGSLLANARNAGPAKSNQKVFAPPLGASLRLGMPERRPDSAGRRDGPSLARRG